jgi:carbon monoxide dehydrogenase subunit G
MLKLTSKTGRANAKPEVVYNYISDFRNFSHLMPADKLQDVEITENTMKFNLSGLGVVGLKIADRHPYQQIVIDSIEGTAADFTFGINISEGDVNSSIVNVNLNANLNMFIEMMAKSPLQQFLDMMMDKLETIKFE